MTAHIERRIAELGQLCEHALQLADRHQRTPRVQSYWLETAAEYSARAFELSGLL